jgi:hypothetical protein
MIYKFQCILAGQQNNTQQSWALALIRACGNVFLDEITYMTATSWRWIRNSACAVAIAAPWSFGDKLYHVTSRGASFDKQNALFAANQRATLLCSRLVSTCLTGIMAVAPLGRSAARDRAHQYGRRLCGEYAMCRLLRFDRISHVCG